MNRISQGDVYFLKSPFNSTVGKDHAKRVAYLLGTVPSRPVVIIRPPVYWDAYGEVMVVPAIHNENEPGIKIAAYDRFGRPTESSYNFMVHAMHTVPVTRLGAFLGRLTNDELYKITDAAKWILDGMSMDSCCDYPVPYDYYEKINKKGPNDTPTTKTYRPENPPDLLIDSDMVLSEIDATGTVKNPMDLDINFDKAISPVIAEELYKDDLFQTKSNKADMNADFPNSRFMKTDLYKYASGYKYPNELMDIIPPTTKALAKTRPTLIDDIRGKDPNITNAMVERVISFYENMTSADVFVYGVWMPKSSLLHMCKHCDSTFTPSEVGALKRLCNIALEAAKGVVSSCDDVAEVDDKEPVEVVPPKKKAPKKVKEKRPKLNTKMINATLNRLRCFMTEQTYTLTPPELLVHFADIPKYMVRKVYAGRKFDDAYKYLLEKANNTDTTMEND